MRLHDVVFIKYRDNFASSGTRNVMEESKIVYNFDSVTQLNASH